MPIFHPVRLRPMRFIIVSRADRACRGYCRGCSNLGRGSCPSQEVYSKTSPRRAPFVNRDSASYFELVISFQVDPQKRQSWYLNAALDSGPGKMQGLILPQTGHVWLISTASLPGCLFPSVWVIVRDLCVACRRKRDKRQ